MRHLRARSETTAGVSGGSLSDYWRFDKSADRARELASILGGAAMQGELVRARLRPAGARRRGVAGSPLVLDPRLLSGFPAPVPSEVVDCIVGLAIRDVALRELSLPPSAWAEWSSLEETERREYSRVYRALEEAFILARLSRLSRTLGLYLISAHEFLAAWSVDGVARGRIL